MTLPRIFSFSSDMRRWRLDWLVRATTLVLLASALASLILLIWRGPVVERTLPTATISPQGGHSYSLNLTPIAPFLYEFRGDSSDQGRRSQLILLRNGTPVGSPHAQHAAIRDAGGGAYSHWHDTLYFSTPENGDPRTDGHRYSVRGPATLSLKARAALVLYIAVALAVTGAFLRRMRADIRWLASPLKIGAIATIGLMMPGSWLPLARTQLDHFLLAGRSRMAVLYLLSVTLGWAAIAIVPFLSNWRVRLALAVPILLGFAADQTMLLVSGGPMAFDMAQILWRERVMAGDAIATYGGAMLTAGGVAAVLAIAYLMPPAGWWRLRSPFALLPVAALATTAALIFATRERPHGLPGPIAVPSQFGVAVALADESGTIPRSPVAYARPLSSPLQKIVMVVDESVRGDTLGLNNPRHSNTPFLNSVRYDIANYGVAISGANCSVAARLMMRIGLQPHELPDTREVWRRKTSIWQFAKQAGYKTVLLDVMRPKTALHSYMDGIEHAAIDEHIDVPDKMTYWTRDAYAAEALVNLLARDERLFIYVNKWGTHPAYHNSFPPDLEYEPGPVESPMPLDEERSKIIRNYHKALNWSVDRFFEKVMPALKRQDLALVYTSDHGQSLFEGGYDLAHCSLTSNLHRGEVYVPLWVITAAPDLRDQFAREARRAHNRASHFEVFPTLLELMGYSRDWVATAYGPGLLNVPVGRKRGFLMGTFFHSGAIWLNAEPNVGSSQKGS